MLEILVAVAILGLGLTAILSAQAGSFASAAHARNISVATGLLRCKMTEVEEHLVRDGFQETDESGAGPCCDNEETPKMRCTWRVERPVFPEAKFGDLNLSSALDFKSPGAGGAANPLMGALGALAGPSPLNGASGITDIAKSLADANMGAATAAGSLLGAPAPSGSAAPPGSPPDMAGGAGMTGAIASLGMSIVYPTFKAILEASTRRITSTLTFREGKKEYSIDVVEWFSIPTAGLTTSDQLDQANAAASPTTTTPTARPTATSPQGPRGGRP